MTSQKVYGLIGIGIGPFNLSLAAMSEAVPRLDAIFFDQNTSFNWHPGLMLPAARLQVPFYADLVTLANPCSRFSYLSFLKETNRLFRFAIHENNFPTRLEYNAYCQWVCTQLKTLRFSCTCREIRYNDHQKIYEVTIWNNVKNREQTFQSKNIVLGTGTSPAFPACAFPAGSESIIHSAEYLRHKSDLLGKDRITIVGSGQSAAEIFNDLLQHRCALSDIHWFTRSSRFYPMEYSKLSLEMTSPDYISYFYSLTGDQKQQVLKTQNMLYKGINYSLINDIYDQVYLQSFNADVSTSKASLGLFTNSELTDISRRGNAHRLSFTHTENQQTFTHETDFVILATGYKNNNYPFLNGICHLTRKDAEGPYFVNKNYSIDQHNSIFVQNADLHTHGFNSADLGMGPYRNAIILNTILGYEEYPVESSIAFQTFGIPKT